MLVPPTDIAEALRAAARATAVPYTLLAAVAYAESAYNASIVGPKTRGGWSASGLMQLSPAVCKTYGLADVDLFDPKRNALTGAKYLATLLDQASGNWERAIAAYHMGWIGLQTAEKSGKVPDATRLYVETVIGNRRWLQAQSKPNGASALERIARAINGLAEANPQLDQITGLWKTFKTWYTSGVGTKVSDSTFLNFPVLEYHWREYARLYDRAPITDERTPRPMDIEPKLWEEMLRKRPLDDGYQQQLDFGTPDAIVRNIESQNAGGGSSLSGFLVIGAVLLLIMRR